MYLRATGRIGLVSLQLLRQRFPEVLLLDALQEGGGKKGLQAPLLPKMGEKCKRSVRDKERQREEEGKIDLD